MANEFLDALKGLGTAVQQYAVSENFRSANERYQQIRKELQPGVAQRQAQIDLANDLFSRLSQAGMKPDAAAAVRSQYMPALPSSAQAAIVQGQLTGDQSMYQAGRQMLQDEEAMKLQTLRQQFENQFNITERLEEGRDRRAALRADQQAQRDAARPIRESDAKSLTEIDKANADLQGILAEIERDPDMAASVTGPVDAAYRRTTFGRWMGSKEQNNLLLRLEQASNEYRRRITGAAAGVQELALLERTSGFSPTQSLSTLKYNLEEMLKIGQAAKQSKLNMIEAMGYNVNKLRSPQGFGMKAAPGDSNTVSNLKRNIRMD